jgi:proline iminopeptidase
MKTLYPKIKPNREWMSQTEDGHQLYVEESGSVDGIPVIFLHGGPGVGCTANHRRFFDPQKYRIILMDQRGAGRSEPHASVENNHTQALINDLESLRKELEIKQWMIMGGSWGSTLALAYAQQHPESVMGMILRSIFLGRQQDIDWFYGGGTRQVFPEHWQDFMIALSKTNASVDDPNQSFETFHKILSGENELARMAIAKAWADWNLKISTLEPHSLSQIDPQAKQAILSAAMISAHYCVNKFFLEENQLINNIDKLQNIPCIIIHGRYDMVSPVENAWTLHQAWPTSELNIIRDAGHLSSEPGITDALIRATKKMHRELSHDCTDPTS